MESLSKKLNKRFIIPYFNDRGANYLSFEVANVDRKNGFSNTPLVEIYFGLNNHNDDSCFQENPFNLCLRILILLYNDQNVNIYNLFQDKSRYSN